MKKRKFVIQVSSVCLLTTLFCLYGCKDKDDDNNEPAIAGYRVISIESYDLDQSLEEKSSFTYVGERIDQINTVDMSSRSDSSRRRLTYPDNNSIIVTEQDYYNGYWEDYGKREMKLQDGKVVEDIEYDRNGEQWDPSIKYTYQYQDDNIKETLIYLYESGQWAPYLKITISYNGNKILDIKYYVYADEWGLVAKEGVSYNGENIEEIIGYFTWDGIQFTEDYKYVFHYEGARMRSIDSFIYEDGVWKPEGEYMSFTYDENGNVISWSDEYFSEDLKFKYQEGKGNFRQVYFTELNFIYGIMVPYPTKSGKDLKQRLLEKMKRRVDV